MAEYELEITEYEQCAWYHKHRHEHPRPHLTVDLLFGLPETNPQENLTMAETTLNITPDETTVDGSLGSVRDLKGNVNSKDPVVSGTWTVSDATLGSVSSPDPSGLTATITTLGVEGTLSVAFGGTTAAGVAVTGAGTIDIAAGPPATVDLALSVPAPAAPAEVPAVAPEAPATPAA